MPGVTSALAAPGLVGIPVTHRGIANQVLILTAHGWWMDGLVGFCSGQVFVGRKGAFPDIPPFLASRTLVFLMVVKRLSDITLQCLIAESKFVKTDFFVYFWLSCSELSIQFTSCIDCKSCYSR